MVGIISSFKDELRANTSIFNVILSGRQDISSPQKLEIIMMVRQLSFRTQ